MTRTGKSTVAIARPTLLVAGILMIAMNLRAPVTSVGPLLDPIRAFFHLRTTEAGMLTTLPLLGFSAISPVAARIARAHGLERSLFGALLLIGAGIGVRAIPAAWCLFLGTGIIGGGIAIGNVLLPSLIKRDFPNKIAKLTSIYALTMGATAAIGSTVAVPLARTSGFGLQGALLAPLLVVLVSAVLWLPQLRNHTAPSKDTAQSSHGGGLWRSALAWQITLFLGLNSFVYYVTIAWLPAMLVDANYSPAEAGNLHGLLNLASALAGLMLMPLVSRMKDQRAIAFGVSILSFIGLTGLLIAPAWAAIWTIVFGLGAGSTIILGLAFVSLRANDARQAAALSAMAQCVGYLLAAIGPTLAGLIHDVQGKWSAALGICSALCLAMAVLGWFAGRAIRIGEASKGKHRLEAQRAVEEAL